MKKYHIIYKTTNLITGKIYVGQHHTNSLVDSYLGSGHALNRSIEKYGRENFKREIIEFCNNRGELDEREVYWIKKLDSRKYEIGYNLCDGGKGAKGRIVSEEQRLQVSRRHKGKIIPKEVIVKRLETRRRTLEAHPEIREKFSNKGECNGMYGKTHSKEAREKISLRGKGKKVSKESIEKGRKTKIENGTYRKPRTEEEKRKISQSKIGKPRDEATKVKLSEAHKKLKVVCKHCKKEVDPRNYGKWHGDKCIVVVGSRGKVFNRADAQNLHSLLHSFKSKIEKGVSLPLRHINVLTHEETYYLHKAALMRHLEISDSAVNSLINKTAGATIKRRYPNCELSVVKAEELNIEQIFEELGGLQIASISELQNNNNIILISEIIKRNLINKSHII